VQKPEKNNKCSNKQLKANHNIKSQHQKTQKAFPNSTERNISEKVVMFMDFSHAHIQKASNKNSFLQLNGWKVRPQIKMHGFTFCQEIEFFFFVGP